jgi:hypothetical protein
MAAATASAALASPLVFSGLKHGADGSPGGIRNIELDVPTNFMEYVAEGVQRTASSSGRPRIVTLYQEKWQHFLEMDMLKC